MWVPQTVTLLVPITWMRNWNPEPCKVTRQVTGRAQFSRTGFSADKGASVPHFSYLFPTPHSLLRSALTEELGSISGEEVGLSVPWSLGNSKKGRKPLSTTSWVSLNKEFFSSHEAGECTLQKESVPFDPRSSIWFAVTVGREWGGGVAPHR